MPCNKSPIFKIKIETISICECGRVEFVKSFEQIALTLIGFQLLKTRNSPQIMLLFNNLFRFVTDLYPNRFNFPECFNKHFVLQCVGCRF